MRLPTVAPFLAFLVCFTWNIALAHAQDDPQTLSISPGFGRLLDIAPDVVGQPLASERPGDNLDSTLVPTTTGVLYWQPGLGASWTNGFARLTVRDDEIVHWQSLDALAPPPAPTYVIASVASPATGVWAAIKGCETPGLGWNANTGNGFYGGLQFDRGTWLANGGGKYAPYAHLATPAQQIEIAENLRAVRGYRPWPACRIRLRLP